MSLSLSESDEANDRSVAPVVGVILLFMLVMAGAGVVLYTGMTLMDDLQTASDAERAETELGEVRHAISTQMLDGDARRVHLSGDYTVVEDGNLSITVAGQYGTGEREVVNATLPALEYEVDGDTLAYQAGGIWRGVDDTSVMHSPPAIEYESSTVGDRTVKQMQLSLVDLVGAPGAGEQEVHQAAVTRHADDVSEDVPFIRTVRIEIENTTYDDAWATFLEDEFETDNPEFDNSVTHYPRNGTVVVEAELDYDRPFAHYVDLVPTIYGGLHAEATTPSGSATVRANGLSIDSYDSRDGPYGSDSDNQTEDVFTFDGDRLNLASSADIQGVPVVNENLQVTPGAEVQPFAFVNGSVTGPDEDEVRTANLSRQFDSIGAVNEEITTAIDYLDGQDPVPPGDIDPGLYSDSSLTRIGTTIDTGPANGTGVHIAVDGDLGLTNVDVTGTGQAHIYVTGDVDVSDVHVDGGDRASALWIYGDENTDVTVDGEFQGVIYAPGSNLNIKKGAEIYGAVVGGTPNIGNEVDVHFDRSLRTDSPIPPGDQQQEWTVNRTNEVDVQFVLDSSGSMDTETSDGEYVPDIVEDATKAGIEQLADGDHRAGVHGYAAEAYTLHPLHPDLDAVESSVALVPYGNTDIGAGIEQALDDFESTGDGDLDRSRHVILMTDGKNHDFGKPKEEMDEETIAQAERADDMGVTIWTIPFTDEADEDLLGDVANLTGGESERVDDPDEMEGVMKRFLEDIQEETEVTVALEVSFEAERSPPANEEVLDVISYEVELE